MSKHQLLIVDFEYPDQLVHHLVELAVELPKPEEKRGIEQPQYFEQVLVFHHVCWLELQGGYVGCYYLGALFPYYGLLGLRRLLEIVVLAQSVKDDRV